MRPSVNIKKTEDGRLYIESDGARWFMIESGELCDALFDCESLDVRETDDGMLWRRDRALEHVQGLDLDESEN